MERGDNIKERLRRYVVNKYVVTCCIFAVVFTFCGEQSLIETRKRKHEISELKKELKETNRQIEEYKHEIATLKDSRENLERFAREHYYMHAENEEVFLIDE